MIFSIFKMHVLVRGATIFTETSLNRYNYCIVQFTGVSLKMAILLSRTCILKIDKNIIGKNMHVLVSAVAFFTETLLNRYNYCAVQLTDVSPKMATPLSRKCILKIEKYIISSKMEIQFFYFQNACPRKSCGCLH